jgi:hypothetical protein
MILLVVEGKERNGTRVCVCLVWYGFVREREKKTREKYNIYYKKKNPLNEIEMKNIRDEREMVKVQVNYKSVLLV